MARSAPRHPHTSARTAPNPAAGSRRFGGRESPDQRLAEPHGHPLDPGRRGGELFDAGRDQLALARAHRIGEPDELRAATTVVHDDAAAPLDARLVVHAPRDAGALVAGDAEPGDVDLVDRFEDTRGVAHQHVGEPGREAAAG